MADDHLREIITRLEIIEARITNLESRVNSSEVQTTPVVPPPVVANMLRPLSEKPQQDVAERQATQKVVYVRQSPEQLTRGEQILAEQNAKASADAEYKIGAKVLPWVGAAVLILSIIFGVSIAYEKGWITPTIIFAGGVALCCGFIGVGQWLRDEREQFGQILTGIGSCGLYCTFAAGHIAQNLFDGKTLTILFLGLSLINLGYCYWRSSTAFLTIGVLGGFIGALMPLQERNVPLHLALHALILVPSAIIIARRKWFTFACLLYPLAMAVLATAQWMNQDHWLKVGSLYFTALVCAAAYGKAYKEAEWDLRSLHLLFSFAGTAWIAFEVRDGYPGSAHIIGFGILIYLLSLLKWDETVKSRLQLAAAGIPLVLAPWGGTKIEASFILAALSLLLAGISQVRFAKTASIFSALLAGLSVTAYLTAHAQGSMTSQVEFILLPLLLLVLGVAVYVLNKQVKLTNQILLGGALVMVPLLNRLVLLTLMQSPTQLRWEDSFLWGLLAGVYALAIIGKRFSVKGPVTFAICLAATALVFWGFTLYQESLTRFQFELPLLIGMTGAVLLTTWSQSKVGSDDQVTLRAIAAWPIGLLFVRFGTLTLSPFVPTPFAAYLSAITGVVVLCILTIRKRTPEFWSATYMLWLIAIFIMFSWYPPRERFAIAQHGLQFGALVFSAIAYDRFLSTPAAMRVMQSIVGLFFFTNLNIHIFTLHSIGALEGPVITVAWAVYATALLILGFAIRASELRYSGLLLIGVTTFKLLTADLATTPDGPRFLITLAVGLAMIGGGYLYIRLQNRLLGEPASEASRPQDERPTVPES